jgi:hypothetical protein
MSFAIHKDLSVALHTLVRDTLDAAGDSAKVVIKNASDATLTTIPLAYPCGAVNASTGRLTMAAASSPMPVLSGTAAYGEVQDKDNKAWLTLPCLAGTTPVDDALVLDSLTVTEGFPVELVSLTIG